MNHGSSSFNSKFGFTIVELLVVIVVIGILAAITIVSYTGITSRANIASMQSDLSNAATKLKLYQADNSTLPVTAADAITAKLISPSPSMDYYSYNVDNTSNSPYFCYMYRKGTDTYAVDSNSAPSKGVCLQSLVVDGNFALDSDSNGLANNWTNQGVMASKSVANNIQIFKASAQYVQLKQDTTLIGSHIYYLRTDVKAISGNILLRLYDGTSMPISVACTTNGTFVTVSGRAGVNAVPTSSKVYIEDLSVSGWVDIQVQNVMLIDLTATFGAGNEPTQAQMDNTIMPQVPNNWFNIVAKANL